MIPKVERIIKGTVLRIEKVDVPRIKKVFLHVLTGIVFSDVCLDRVAELRHWCCLSWPSEHKHETYAAVNCVRVFGKSTLLPGSPRRLFTVAVNCMVSPVLVLDTVYKSSPFKQAINGQWLSIN